MIGLIFGGLAAFLLLLWLVFSAVRVHRMWKYFDMWDDMDQLHSQRMRNVMHHLEEQNGLRRQEINDLKWHKLAEYATTERVNSLRDMIVEKLDALEVRVDNGAGYCARLKDRIEATETDVKRALQKFFTEFHNQMFTLVLDEMNKKPGRKRGSK